VISHLTDADLRSRIVTKLGARKLPVEHPKQTWGGPSQGQRCSGCDEPIAAAEMEFEVAAADGITRYFHARCYGILEAERTARRGPKRR
jgi:hypothetical protein